MASARVLPGAVPTGEQTSAEALSNVSALLRHAVRLQDGLPNREQIVSKLDQLAQTVKNGVDVHIVPDVIQEVVVSVNIPALLNTLSPQEVCVFRDSLLQAGSELPSDAVTRLASIRNNVESAVRTAIDSQARSDISIALHGDASLLRSTVISGLTAKEDLQHVGKTIQGMFSRHNLLDTSISSSAREAIRRMTLAAASPLPAEVIQELNERKILAICAAHATKQELMELRDAIGKAAASGVSVELMGLWQLVHETTVRLFPSQPVHAFVEEVIDLSDGVRSTASESVQAVGRLLGDAFSSSFSLLSSASVELQEGLKAMASYGTVLSGDLCKELQAQLSTVAQALPSDKLDELHRLLQEHDWSGDMGEVATQLRQATDLSVLRPAVEMVYASALSATALCIDFDETMGQLFAQSRESLQAAMHAIVNGFPSAKTFLMTVLSVFPPLLRFEILRDFCQTVSLFFTNLYGSIERNQDSALVRGTQLFFQSVYNIVSADFTALWAAKREMLIDIGFATLLVLIILAYSAYVWFAASGRHLHKRSEEIRHGHEASSWAEIATKQQWRLRIFTAVITLCLTMYLPVTRVCLEIVAASIAMKQLSVRDLTGLVSPSTLTIMDRYGDYPVVWQALQVGAIVLLVSFTLPLPLLLVQAISENRPTGSPENPLVTYDIDGEQVPFDDKVYARLVASDPSQLRCPYRSLYAGFEQRWSHYKVFQLLFKVALVVPLIMTRQIGIRSVVTTVIYGLIVLLTSYGTPFNDPLNNTMEISGKIAALVTCLGGVLLAFLSKHERVQVAVGIMVKVVNAVNLIVMAAIVLLGIKTTRLWIKNRFGTLTFSDTVRDILDAPGHTIIPHWDLEKEAKHRIWHHFWNSVLMSLEGQKEIVHRLSVLQRAVTESGVENVKRHWQGHANEYIASMRLAARRLLEGVDVYWDDATGARDGYLDSKSYFGKMYIRPYPFHCVLVYDDAQDESIIRDDKFTAFFFLNFSPEVMAKRLLRQKLRALSEQDVEIYYPFSRQETVSVEDGTETITTTDAEGRTHTSTRTRYSTVQFTCYYTNGVIKVIGNSTKEMTAGFQVTMIYRDGHGEAVAPHTGQVHPQQNRVAAMGPDHIGLTPEMKESPQVAGIFQQTQGRWQTGLAELHERHNQYRIKLMEKHSAANRILGDGFWFFVLNNPRLPRARLEHYLRTGESNPALRRLGETHSVALDFLYERLRFVHSHPACKLWYVFWDDVFARNGDMKSMKKIAGETNPMQATSIVYRVIKRDDLKIWLQEHRLFGEPFSWKTIFLGRRCLFHDKILNVLYERLHQLMDPNTIPVK